jgi:phage N-6-adenine-methyltransferase
VSLNAGLFSSAKEDWETPDSLMATIPIKFDLDVCASATNAKAPRFFTKEDDGLKQVWQGKCWMNPPYGRTIGAWVKKASESGKGGTVVVCLLPARTDTAWFQDFVYPVLKSKPRDVKFLRGRLKFVGAKSSAPFPSMLVAFR